MYVLYGGTKDVIYDLRYIDRMVFDYFVPGTLEL